jgi:HK97 family phage portal protein
LNFINNIKAFFRNPENQIQGLTGRGLFTPIWTQPPRRGAAQWLDLYMKSPRMAPIHKIATDVATSSYKLRVKNTDPARIIKEHPLLKLLKNPCSLREITGYTLLYLTEVYRDLPAGEAFWLIERNGLGVPSEIWIIPPNWVIYTPTQEIPYFNVLPQGNSSYRNVYVAPEDMIWFKEPDPLNPYGRGRGRAEAIGDEMETDEYMAKWAKMFFFNQGMPPVIIEAPGADEPTVKRLQDEWMQKYGGYRNGHKPAILPWSAKVTKLNDTQKEMDYSQSRKDLRDACNQFWNMPPELFGILENSNRSTIDAAYYIYTKNVLSQRLKSFDEVVNSQLLPMFDDRLELVHDNVVPQDVEFELKKATEGLKYGGVTVDEWRRSQGYEDLPDKKGNMMYVPLNMTPYPISDDIENLPNHSEEDGTPPDKSVRNKKYTERHKTAIWKNFDKAAIKYERRVESSLKKYFQGQQDRLTKAFEKSYSDIIAKEETDDPDELLDWTAETAALVGVLKPFWLKSAEEGYSVAAELLNIDFEFGIVEPRLLKWIKKNGLERAKGINDTTREALRKTLTEGIAAGESTAKLRDRISAIYTTAKTSRANTIARTETMTTVNVGNFETMKAAGVEKISWLSSRDGRVRDSHSNLDGEIVEVGQPFSNGLRHPHDDGPVEEVVNCRCTAIVPDEE